MAKLQRLIIPNKPYERKHYQYTITIPKKISTILKLTDGQKAYIKHTSPRRCTIYLDKTADTIPITISYNNTNIYNGKQNFVTRCIIPIEIIRKCSFKKGDEFYFDERINSEHRSVSFSKQKVNS